MSREGEKEEVERKKNDERSRCWLSEKRKKKNKRNVEKRRSQDKGKLRRGRGEAAGWLVPCILNKIVKKSGVPKAKAMR